MWGLKRHNPAVRTMLLQWHVTERCNLRCAHCYQSPDRVPELPFDDLLKVLNQFIELLDRFNPPARGHVTLTGGEPFLRPDFLRLLETVAALKPRICFAVLTNGSLVDEEMAWRLAKLGPGFVQVSLDGVQSTHDAVRGEGNFERTVEAARNLSRARIPTYISFTAHRGNYREFPEVVRIGRKAGATRVWADRLVPIGACQLETLTKDETRAFVHIMRESREEAHRGWFSNTQVPMHRALQFLDGGWPYHCTAGDTLITVEPNGDVCPCRRMPSLVGNVFERPLAEIYFESPLLTALRDRGRICEGCESCEHEPKCRGGLRCLSAAVTGNPLTADPGCWLTDPYKG
ncbi:MAG: radical SAM protein [Acidobacteria bacterium]|nr:radical SAM protein [Acidobacteriota bacterium]